MRCQIKLTRTVKDFTECSLLNELIVPPLTPKEISYRVKIQENLESYISIWKLIDKLWHIKPEKFEYMNLWKEHQEIELFKKKGSALLSKNLSNFIRMLSTCLPKESFEKIDSNVLITINQERKIVKAAMNKFNSK